MDGFNAYRKYVNPALAQLEEMTETAVKFTRADGCYVWDVNGAKYLDFLSGFGSFNLGHNPKEISAVIQTELEKAPLQIYGIGASPYIGNVASEICRVTGSSYEIVTLTGSGTEAIEGAIKMAHVFTGRKEVLYCHNAYHGTTLGSLSMMGKGPWRAPFESLLSDFTPIPFNDLNALEEKLKSRRFCAFVVEPIQIEAGIIIPDSSYLQKAVELCREYGTVSVFDEVQTGMGRTGTLWSFQESGANPDIFCIAKSLGGGIMPIGAFVTTRDIYEKSYGAYESCSVCYTTFSGNSLSCTAALKAIEMLSSEKMLSHAKKMSDYLYASIKDILKKKELIQAIRHKGLLMGIEFKYPVNPWLAWENMGLKEFAGLNPAPSLIMKHLLKNKVLANICGHNWNVLRVEPPLIVNAEEIDIFAEKLKNAIKWIETLW